MNRSSGSPRPVPARRRAPRGAVRRVATLAGLSGLVLVSTTACAVPTFGFPKGVTVQSHRVLNLWEGSAIAALAVGVFVWSLIGFAVVVYRKKTDELPRQVRYNLPVEVLYTVVPFVIVGALFYYTARDEIFVDKLSKRPQVTVGVVAFRWNWQFNYLDQNQKTVMSVTGRPSQPAVMVLPSHRTVRFLETSPDVIHSFWVPEFLFKRDVVPGRVNQFEVTILKEGTYIGRCAELCGVDHDRMDFYVKVVPPAQYDAMMNSASLAAHRTGKPLSAVPTVASVTTAATPSQTGAATSKGSTK